MKKGDILFRWFHRLKRHTVIEAERVPNPSLTATLHPCPLYNVTICGVLCKLSVLEHLHTHLHDAVWVFSTRTMRCHVLPFDEFNHHDSFNDSVKVREAVCVLLNPLAHAFLSACPPSAKKRMSRRVVTRGLRVLLSKDEVLAMAKQSGTARGNAKACLLALDRDLAKLSYCVDDDSTLGILRLELRRVCAHMLERLQCVRKRKALHMDRPDVKRTKITIGAQRVFTHCPSWEELVSGDVVMRE